MDNISQLSAGAARLLLVLLLGGSNLPAEQQRARAGIDSRSAYFRAKQQLRDLGFTDARGVPLSGTDQSHLLGLVPPTGTPPVPLSGTSPTERDSPVPPTGTRSAIVPLSGTPLGRVTDEGDFSGGITGSWLGQCADADRMPRDGEPTQRGSNWQARRRAQIAALRGAYSDLFAGQQLHPAAAKDMLRLSHDSAEAVYEAMEKASAKRPQSPPSYIMGILKREAAEVPPPAPAQVAAPADPEELKPWTQADHDYGVRMARLLARKGYDMTGVIPGE